MGRTVYIPSLSACGCIYLSVWSIIYDFSGFRRLKYFFPVEKGEKVILLGYPLFLHRTPANLFLYGDIILTCVWTVFQAASFVACSFPHAGPGAPPPPPPPPPPHPSGSSPSLYCFCTVPVVTVQQSPGSGSPFSATCEWIFWLQNCSHKCHFHGWGKQKIFGGNCIFYVLLFCKSLVGNSVDPIQLPLSRRNRR